MTTTDDATGPRPRSLLRHADFRKLWAAETISVVGSQVSQLAIPLVAILVLHATALEVGLLTAVEFLPFLLVGLPAGVWVDRMRRRPILVVADLGRAIALASIPIAYLLGALTIYQLFVVGFVNGVFTVFFDVAYTSYLPALVERDELVDGNSKLQVSQSAAQIAGPGMAGALVQLIGAPIAILADSLSFLGSALFLTRIRTREPAPERAAAGSAGSGMRRQIAEGLRFVLGHPYLRTIVISASVSNLFSAIFGAVILLFAVRELRLDAPTIGLILALGNLGILFGALLSGRITRRIGVGRAIIGGGVLGGLGSMLIPLATVLPPVPVSIIGLFFGAFCGVLFNINQLSLRQALTPRPMLGRMNATVRFVAWGSLPIGSVIGGVLATVIGLSATLWVGAIGSMLSFVPILWSPVRSVKTIPTEPDAATSGPTHATDEPGSVAGLGNPTTAGPPAHDLAVDSPGGS